MEVLLDEQYLCIVHDTVHDEQYFFLRRRIRVFEEEDARVRIFAPILCQNFGRDFRIIIDVSNTLNI